MPQQLTLINLFFRKKILFVIICQKRDGLVKSWPLKSIRIKHDIRKLLGEFATLLTMGPEISDIGFWNANHEGVKKKFNPEYHGIVNNRNRNAS